MRYPIKPQIAIFIVCALAWVVSPPRVIGQSVSKEGQIVKTDNDRGTVWINLGSADGVRRHDIADVLRPQKDAEDREVATIEITRVIERHLAEARIIKQDATARIETGDQLRIVASP